MAAEITVVDPGHPLYGRRFAVAGISSGRRADARLTVTYRPGVVLMVPITATSLRPDPGPSPAAAKLCVEGLRELAALAGESEGLCPSGPPPSGRPCRRTCAGRSSTTSPPCLGR